MSSTTSAYSKDITIILDEPLFSFDELTQYNSIQSKLLKEINEKRVFFVAEHHELSINPEYQFFFLKYLHENAEVRNIFTKYSYGTCLLIDRYLKSTSGYKSFTDLYAM